MPQKKAAPTRPTSEAVVGAARAIARLSRRLEVALAEADLTLSQYRVLSFLAGLDRFAPALAAVRGRMDGTDDVLRVIEHRLAQRRAATATA